MFLSISGFVIIIIAHLKLILSDGFYLFIISNDIQVAILPSQ